MRGKTACLAAVLVAGCTRAATAPVAPAPDARADVDAETLPDARAARDAGSDARVDAAAATPKVEARTIPVTGGTFPAAFGETFPMAAVRVAVRPISILPTDQRVSGAAIEDRDRDDPRARPPFTQVGAYRSANGKRHIALVEARPRSDVPLGDEAGSEAPLAAWFTQGPRASALARPAGTATAWRTWKGGAPQWVPDILAVEDAVGEPVAIRFLDAVERVTPLAIDERVPMFVAVKLGSASGVDDPVTLEVVGYVDGELRALLEVPAGPRSSNCENGRCTVQGPLGSIAASALGGKPALRVRAVLETEQAPCYPGQMSDPGCPGEERIDAWDGAARAFQRGAPKPILFRQQPGKSVVVAPG